MPSPEPTGGHDAAGFNRGNCRCGSVAGGRAGAGARAAQATPPSQRRPKLVTVAGTSITASKLVHEVPVWSLHCGHISICLNKADYIAKQATVRTRFPPSHQVD
jgi:hypothetical protein